MKITRVETVRVTEDVNIVRLFTELPSPWPKSMSTQNLCVIFEMLIKDTDKYLASNFPGIEVSKTDLHI